MANAPLRQWIIMRSIPRHPRKTTAADIAERLREEGIRTTRRTIERDLNDLSGLFPLVVDDRSRPYGWSWSAEGVPLDVPGMEPETALTFKILEHFAGRMLPKHTLSRLRPHIDLADQVLRNLDPAEGLRIWPDRVRVLPRGLQLREPETDPGVVAAVYQALLERRRFRLQYYSRFQACEREYEVNPLGLLFRDQVIYLVCTLWDYDDIKQLALHRMRQLDFLDTPVREPEAFDMDAFIAQGGFTYDAGDTIRVRLAFTRNAAFHLYETPLSEDQVLRERGDRVEVTASVLDSQPLRWWLRAFGPQVEVLAPQALRDELSAEASALAALYSEPTADTAGTAALEATESSRSGG
jgi:predicted DNA-binding transcriptional regulator YafY